MKGIERVTTTLKNALKIIKNYETEQWHTILEELQLAMNCITHWVTGVALLEINTHRKYWWILTTKPLILKRLYNKYNRKWSVLANRSDNATYMRTKCIIFKEEIMYWLRIIPATTPRWILNSANRIKSIEFWKIIAKLPMISCAVPHDMVISLPYRSKMNHLLTEI